MTSDTVKKLRKIIGTALFIIISGATVWLASNDYLTLEKLQASLSVLEQQYADNPVYFVVLYITIYVVIVALFLPGLFLMNLLAGAVLGPLWGITIAAVSTALGSLTGFLTSRYMFARWVQGKYPKKTKSLNKVVVKNSWLTIILLRFAPALPVGLTNLFMGVTKVNTRVFFIATLIGVVPWVAFYVITGVELASIKSANDILSLEMSLIVLGFILLLGLGRVVVSKASIPK